MAFGFSPKHKQDFILDDLDKDYFLGLALETALTLSWNISFASETGFIAYTKFSWSSFSEEVTVKIDDQLANLKSECTGNQLYDWGKNKKNIEAFLSTFEEVKASVTQEEIENRLNEHRQSFASVEDDILSKPPSTAKEKITGFFALFKPIEGYFISPILINLNILVFIAMVVSGVHFLLPEGQSLVDWGANFRPLTLDGQWWRLFTACFLHIGIFHLLLNMYALLYIGLLLEPYLGKTRFLAAYLLSGIAASITSLWWHDLTISAGASGAIFGMYGVFLALLTTDLLDKAARKALITSIAVFVGYNILNGLKPNSGIDNAAHIGGLISGLIIGYSFVPSLKDYDNPQIKYSTISWLTILLVSSSFFIYQVIPNDKVGSQPLQYDIDKYEKEMERFISMESMALEIYNLPRDTPDDKILTEIQDRGLYYWHENLKLVDNFQNLELPLVIRERNSKLKEYCELRIKLYELIYKAIDEDTDLYESEINDYNLKIEAIVTELTGGQ